MEDLYLRSKHIKTENSYKKTQGKSFDVRFRNDFLDMIAKTQTKENTDNWSSSKFNFHASEDTSRVRQSTEWEKTFTSHVQKEINTQSI